MTAMLALSTTHPEAFDCLMTNHTSLGWPFTVLAPPKVAFSKRGVDRPSALATFGTIDQMGDTFVAGPYLQGRDA